jgi:hypothetical protein
MSVAPVVALALAASQSPLVVLHGTLRTKIAFGPPNFGENPKSDSRFRVYYVRLAKPLNRIQLDLPPDNQWPANEKYSVVQLRCNDSFKTCERFLKRHIGQAIFAAGSTAWQQYPADVYSVIMTVEALAGTP